jgi:hypothetical protein
MILNNMKWTKMILLKIKKLVNVNLWSKKLRLSKHKIAHEFKVIMMRAIP